METDQELAEHQSQFVNAANLIDSRRKELQHKTPYFMFLVKGNFPEGKVKLLPPTSKRIDSYSRQTSELINQEWGEFLAEAKEHGRELFNNPYLGLEAFAVTPHGELIIKTHETSYKEYVGLRFHQEIPYSEQPNPISVGMLIVLKDGILVPQRSEKTEDLPLGLEIPAGWPSRQEVESGEFLKNPFVSAYRELEEETGIKPDEARLTCRGIVLENHAVHPILIFEAVSNLRKEEVLRRKRDEEGEMHFIDNTPEVVRATILRKSVYSIPPLPAALYDYGYRTFGSEWKNEVDKKLSRLAHLLNVYVKTPGRRLKGLKSKVK